MNNKKKNYWWDKLSGVFYIVRINKRKLQTKCWEVLWQDHGIEIWCRDISILCYCCEVMYVHYPGWKFYIYTCVCIYINGGCRWG